MVSKEASKLGDSPLGTGLEDGKGGFPVDFAGLKCCCSVLNTGRGLDDPLDGAARASLGPDMPSFVSLEEGPFAFASSGTVLVVELLDRDRALSGKPVRAGLDSIFCTLGLVVTL